MWKVSKEKIEVFPHPNADSLELGKVGEYQVVVPKGKFKTGDDVVFVPKRSLLSGALKKEFEQYLLGPENNRVGQVRLRGELSEGIIVPPHLLGPALGAVETGVDLSSVLGIEQYVPPVPASFGGTLKPYPYGLLIANHRVNQFGTHGSKISDDDDVIITEKLHGSHIVVTVYDGVVYISSKGLHAKMLHILEESEFNIYWQAYHNSGLSNIITPPDNYDVLQLFGEVVPAQGGNWTYGFKKPTIRLFDVKINNTSVEAPEEIKHLWVPTLYTGKKSGADFDTLRKGKEQVSGEELHIREGVVMRPKNLKNSLFVKIINPKYAKKETGEELS